MESSPGCRAVRGVPGCALAPRRLGRMYTRRDAHSTTHHHVDSVCTVAVYICTVQRRIATQLRQTQRPHYTVVRVSRVPFTYLAGSLHMSQMVILFPPDNIYIPLDTKVHFCSHATNTRSTRYLTTPATFITKCATGAQTAAFIHAYRLLEQPPCCCVRSTRSCSARSPRAGGERGREPVSPNSRHPHAASVEAHTTMLFSM